MDRRADYLRGYSFNTYTKRTKSKQTEAQRETKTKTQ